MGVDFVSTNDILTSHFGELSSVRILHMAMNFRGRLPGIEHTDAGNYECALLYDQVHTVYIRTPPDQPAGVRVDSEVDSCCSSLQKSRMY